MSTKNNRPHYTGATRNVPEQISRDLADLRAATREAHEAIKDLRAETKKAEEVRETMMVAAAVVLTSGISDIVREGLEGYQASMAQATEEATRAIFKRFDKIAEMLLHGTGGFDLNMDEVAKAVVLWRKLEAEGCSLMDRSRDEDLKAISDDLVDAFEAHPAHLPGMRLIVLIEHPLETGTARSAFGARGYSDMADVATDMLFHMAAIFRSAGKDFGVILGNQRVNIGDKVDLREFKVNGEDQL